MKPIRSFLFVPGNKDSWIEKAATSGADALILDLEDSVPVTEKVAAREIVAARIGWLADRGQRIWVRINKSAYLYDFDDLLAVAQPGLEGVVVSKPEGPEDVHTAVSMVAEAESRNHLPFGSIKLLPILETARSMQRCYEIAEISRVVGLVGVTAKNADVGRALKFVWSPGGRETDYFKSRVVMAARAAGKLPIGGLWQHVHDLEGAEQLALLDRQLGMTGQLLLHPSNVPIVNRTFSPTPEELAYFRGMIDALEEAQSAGRASTMYEGEHIDIAHAKTARDIIGMAGVIQP